MKFSTPREEYEVDIPDEWWEFCDMNAEFERAGDFYPYSQSCVKEIDVVELKEIQPIVREAGINGFRKYKMVPVLMALRDREGTLPPIEVCIAENAPTYTYRLKNGFHRYYASVAVGFSRIPVVVKPE